jgi:hypothetical protein
MKTAFFRSLVAGAIAVAVVTGVSAGPARAEMSAADKLMAIEQIHQLKARYFRCVDAKDWECFYGVFSPDISFKLGKNEWHGHDGMVKLMTDAGFYDRVKSTHHGFNPEIEILSPTTAKGIWSMEDYIYYPAGLEPKSDKEALKPGQTLHGFGHYHETYVKIKGKWYIQSEELTRTREDVSGVTFK